MRLPSCKPVWQSHYYNKDNICIHCGFDYGKMLAQVEKFKKEIANSPVEKGTQK